MLTVAAATTKAMKTITEEANHDSGYCRTTVVENRKTNIKINGRFFFTFPDLKYSLMYLGLNCLRENFGVLYKIKYTIRAVNIMKSAKMNLTP